MSRFVDNIIFCHKYILGGALVKFCIVSIFIIIGNLLISYMQTYLSAFIVKLFVSREGFSQILELLACYVLILYFLTVIIKRAEASVNKDINNRRMLKSQDYYLTLCKTAYENLDNSGFRIRYETGQESYYDGDHTGFHNYILDFRMLLQSVIGLCVYCTLVAQVDFRISIIELLLSAIILSFNLYRKKWVTDNQDKWKALDMKLDYLRRESIANKNAKEVRLYPIKKWFLSKWDELIVSRLDWYKKEQILSFLTKWGGHILSTIKYGYAYFIVINQVKQGLPVNDFVLSVGLVLGINNWTNQIFENLQYLQLNSIHITNTRQVLTGCSEESHKKILYKQNNRAPEIRFENVSFCFPETSEYVINNLNLVIHSGEKIAIVGNNGAGKTTLVKLLCGLYHPVSGKIYIDGVDTTCIESIEYYKGITAIFQDCHLLATTILENISCKPSEETDISRVKTCLSLVGLSKYIEALPHGIFSNLTKELDSQGVIPSGGEKQKILIARCLYKDSPILILDEPTSSLDAITESKIYQEYHTLTEGKTSLFISHRLSSTKFCDRIIVLKKGKIIEEGTHEQLINQDGEYKQMFIMQSSYYQEE